MTIDGAADGAGATVEVVAPAMAPGGTNAEADDRTRLKLQRLVAGVLQEVEHAGLVRAQIHTGVNGFDYTLTRRGRRALAEGSVLKLLAGQG